MNPFQTLNATMLEVKYIFENTKNNGFHQAPYAKFLLLAPIMEFMGAFYDGKEFDDRGVGKDRFRRLIERHFPKYQTLNLYANYRCGMLHRLSPKGNLDLITIRDLKTNLIYKNKSHLDGIMIDNCQMRLIVLENLYEDLIKANEAIQENKQQILEERRRDEHWVKLKEMTDDYLKN